MTLLQLFYKFLKDNNILYLYKKNLKNRKIRNGETWYDINDINNVRAFLLLSNSFNWRETNEKFDFWFNQTRKWQKIIIEYYKTIEAKKEPLYFHDVLTKYKVKKTNEFINLINKYKTMY